MLRDVPCLPTLIRLFIMNGCWIFIGAFSTSIKMFMWFCLFFHLSHWWVCISWTILVTLGWIQLDCRIWGVFFILLYLVANILSSIFASLFFKDIACTFLFWYCHLLVLVSGDGGFLELLWGCSSHFYLLEDFEKDWYKFLFICLVEFPSEVIWS